LGDEFGMTGMSRLYTALAVVSICGLLAASPAMSAEPLRLTYKVSHSMFGDIGTYTNTIEPAAGGVTVQTQAHFAINALGVPLYHEDSTRTEQWQGDRLVAFHGLTTRGADSKKIDGQARGNS
jgi:hypothetical protein